MGKHGGSPVTMDCDALARHAASKLDSDSASAREDGVKGLVYIAREHGTSAEFYEAIAPYVKQKSTCTVSVRVVGALLKMGHNDAVASIVKVCGDVNALVAECIENEQQEVREAATRMIARLIEDGSVSAVPSLVLCSGDDAMPVREVAACALPLLNESQHGSAVPMLIKHMKHKKWHVRGAVLYAMGRIAGKSNAEKATTAAIEGLVDHEAEVRKVAEKTLGPLVKKCGPTGLATLVEASAHESPEVREAVAPVLRALKIEADATHIEAVAKLARSNKYDTRFAAIFALRRFAARGDAVAIAAATNALSDKRAEVRECAAEALRHLADKGNKTVAAALAKRLSDEEVKVQVKALRSLNEIASRGDKSTLATLTELLKDDRWKVRAVALRSLRCLVIRGDAATAEAIAACLKDSRWEIRWDAAAALHDAIAPADESAVSVVQSHLDDTRWGVRLFAAYAMWGIAERGYGSKLGTSLVVLCALVAALLLSNGLLPRTQAASEPEIVVPYPVPLEGTSRFSGLIWAVDVFLRLAAAVLLCGLTVKGRGSTAGTAVGGIAVGAIALALRAG